MPWQQIICRTDKYNQENISELLDIYNVLSITIQDAEDKPVLEPLPGETPLWDNLIITALFDIDRNLDELLACMENHSANWNISQIRTETIKDQVWERAWIEHFHPMQFGENLWIYPSNHEIPDDDSVKITLDPGLAFGTGTHPTTALCLEWLDQNPPRHLDVIDYGCGSGILAIAALKLGAHRVLATDIDPQAITATHQNSLRNHLDEETIHCLLPDKLPTTPADLLIANILSGPLLELYPVFDSLIKSGGQLLLSGILEEQHPDIIKRYSKSFNHLKIKVLDGWVRMSGEKCQ